MIKKYILGEKHNYFNLYKVVALKDFGNVKKGEVGGWVAGEHNLSHAGNCWVYDEATVWGNAQVCGNVKIYWYVEVYGNAKVSGEIKIFGNSKKEVYIKDIKLHTAETITKTPINITGLPNHDIVITDNYVYIGCEVHTVEYWLENYEEIGKINNYTKEEIKLYGNFLNSIKGMQK